MNTIDPDRSLAHRFEQCYSGAVYDVLRSKGHPDCVLPHDLRPLVPEHVLAGPIYTVSGRAQAADGHETLLAWTGLLSKAPGGSVLICQPDDSTMAHMGELSSETLLLRGVRGYIVDGGCRDSHFIRRSGFKVWCRYFTPRDIVGRWLPETFGGTIEIGGVPIQSGDFVLADFDGVVIIPAALVEEVLCEVEQVLRTESDVRKAILQGIDPQQAYLEHGKF